MPHSLCPRHATAYEDTQSLTSRFSVVGAEQAFRFRHSIGSSCSLTLPVTVRTALAPRHEWRPVLSLLLHRSPLHGGHELQPTSLVPQTPKLPVLEEHDC